MWYDREIVRDVLDDVKLEPHQRVNHFRNHYELTRKDLLVKNLKRHKKQLAKEGKHEEVLLYDFFPPTLVLPAEYSIFVESYKKNPGSIWIMKPIAKSQGKGIFLFTKLSQIADWRNDQRLNTKAEAPESYVVQEYLSNPLLIGGKKFDLRVYALVTSYSPLIIYLSRTGFARFTSTRFTLNPDDLVNAFIHLTNVAVQKTGPKYDPNSGGKMNIHNLKLYMFSKFGIERTNKCFTEIANIMIRSLVAVQRVLFASRSCFELYGFDILIDKDLKPWLIEVNASPSLTANTADDWALKIGLLDDTMTIIDMESKLAGDEEQIGGFDLVYRNGPMKIDPNCLFQTNLGAANNRDENLVELAKQYKKRQQL